MSNKYPQIVFWLTLCVSMCCCKYYAKHITRLTPTEKRLWGGFRRNSNNAGWQVRIVSDDGAATCGGAYIAPLLVVTSADCIEPFRYVLGQVSVESMAYTDSNFERSVSIDTIYIPEDIEEQRAGDIALVRLQRPIKGKRTEFIRLCDTEMKDGMKLRVIGHDRRSLQVDTVSNSTVIVEDKEICRETFKDLDSVQDSSSCVLHLVTDMKCRYNRGSPLVYKKELCGLISWGPWCNLESDSEIFTNINSVKEFIEQTEYEIETGYLA